MKVEGQVVVVTGGANGIGRALCERFALDGAKKVIVADYLRDAAVRVADTIGGEAFTCDVSDEPQVAELVRSTEERFGPIGLFCSNAGIADFGGAPLDATASINSAWQRGWEVNVMAHVYAARALVPRMLARGGGYFLHTVSAAGLLNQIGGAVYATTKHAAIGFAENLAITHRDQGIRVSILCPQGVDTPMLRAMGEGPQNIDGVLSAEQVAQAVTLALADERFLILPHPQVADYMKKKVDDYDRWIGGMAKLQRQVAATLGSKPGEPAGT